MRSLSRRERNGGLDGARLDLESDKGANMNPDKGMITGENRKV